MKKYSEEDKAWLVQEWEKSGKSRWAFTKELGLNYQTFSNWAQKAVPAGGFIEVSGKLTGGGTEGESRTGYGIVVESGPVKVHLPAGVTQADLALVVQVLR